MFKGIFSFVILALVAGFAQPVDARQGQAALPATQDSTQSAATPARPSDAPPPTHVIDVGDLWHHVRPSRPSDDQAKARSASRPFFFVAPSVASKPSTGLQVGVASSVVFVNGDPSTTHLSSGDWSVSDSVKGQKGTSVRFRIFTPGNRWFIQGDNRLAWSNQNTYELGIVAGATPQKLKFNRRRVSDMLFRQVRPKVLVGFGLNVNDHANVRAGSGTDEAFQQSAYVTYTTEHGYATDRQISSGTAVGVVMDTRNNSINASRGWLLGANYRTFFAGFLGGSSTWQWLDVDARTYRPLGHNGRQTLALWMFGEFVTGGHAPYLDLPGIADDMYGRSARGYTTGRYRGPRLVYGEVEYRATLLANGLLGAVVFANATAVDGGTPDQPLFGELAPATGAGLRVLLSKRTRANLCLDYGWGSHGSRGLYLAVRETF